MVSLTFKHHSQLLTENTMYTKEGTIQDRREMLRIKVKSLAAGARKIRARGRKSHGMLRDEMRNHRVLDVRRESRSAGLALGFVKGRTLEEMENVSFTPP